MVFLGFFLEFSQDKPIPFRSWQKQSRLPGASGLPAMPPEGRPTSPPSVKNMVCLWRFEVFFCHKIWRFDVL